MKVYTYPAVDRKKVSIESLRSYYNESVDFPDRNSLRSIGRRHYRNMRKFNLMPILAREAVIGRLVIVSKEKVQVR